MQLRNKTILILSPQAWGTMFISKHHYAIELAKRGNRVYFLNPPVVHNRFSKTLINIQPLEEFKNLFLIHHQYSFPYVLYFHFPFLYHILVRKHILKLIKSIQSPVDCVWSFDIGNLYPLRYFAKTNLKIFHPVDEPLTKNAIQAAGNSNLIFSVTKEILDKYKHEAIPKYLISHGVALDFFQENSGQRTSSKVKIGYSGNLTRQDIDRSTLRQIIQTNRELEFHFWGSYEARSSNVSGNNDSDTNAFVRFLKEQPNAFLHGPVSTKALARGYTEMDAFLICYDIQKDQSKGTNYHKIMEFLATGKPVVSNNVTAFYNTEDLVYMSPERDSNKSLPFVFESAITNLSYLNSETLQNKRRAFAYDNRYSKQVERIETILQSIPQG